MEQTGVYFGDVTYMWLESVKPTLASSSYHKYEQTIRLYLFPYFDCITCSELSYDILYDFHRYIDSLEQDGGHCPSCGGRRIIFMILNKALHYAYVNRIICEPMYLKPSVKRENHIVMVFTEKDVKKLEKYIFAHKNYDSLAILLALYTGMRIGELCALKWENIDFVNASIHITGSAQRVRTGSAEENSKTKLAVLPPKSKNSIRLIPLPEFVLSYLRTFRVHVSEGDYIFTRVPGKPCDARTLQYAYRKILSLCAIPYLNFHCLRHTFATRCVTSGWDMKTLSEILGHADINITMEYYFHSSFEHKRQQMSKLKRLS